MPTCLYRKIWYFADQTQDAAEDENQLSRVKDWIISNISETVEFTDVLANFPDISVVIIVSLDKLHLQFVLFLKFVLAISCF